MMRTYRIVRMYQDPQWRSRTIRRGLTLDEAQTHCSDPETSSRTCTNPGGKRRTLARGPWFDAYEEE